MHLILEILGYFFYFPWGRISDCNCLHCFNVGEWNKQKKTLKKLCFWENLALKELRMTTGMSPGSHYWSYFPDTLSFLSSHSNLFNTLRPTQNGRHFPDDIFKWIFLKENVWISINISLKFLPRGPINNIPALVQVMACCLVGTKPLSEPMMVRLPTHICVTQPQWVKDCGYL